MKLVGSGPRGTAPLKACCTIAKLAGALGIGTLSLALAANDSYSPNPDSDRTQLYWGDLHLHTSNSADAYTMGSRITPETAYRFARGEVVQAGNGMSVRPRYRHDFLAISDHAEYLSVYRLLDAEDSRLKGWALGDDWLALLRSDRMGELTMAFSDAFQNPTPEKMTPPEVVSAAWQDAVATADRYNQPHLFTAFPAYEWTSTISGDNLHRVVLYREGRGHADQLVPFSSQDSNDPEDLWAAMARYESVTKGSTLAIPHNSNVSNGRMFAPRTLSGIPLSREYAEARVRWEPLLEVTQVKGDSETHPFVSPNDRYADFERWDEGNIALTADKADWMFAQEYARPALAKGLAYRQSLGANPYQFGLIGATDSHTGYSAVSEDNFFGKFRSTEPSAERMFTKMAQVLNENWRLSASGLTGVWATENTREGLFDALQRKEVYATTGSRIQLRFFGGWDFTEQDLSAVPISSVGYKRGVPMGSSLLLPAGQVSEATAPRFIVLAMKEPDGPDLHALQVVKAWIDDQGKPKEQVYDVALAGVEEADGRASMRAVWMDPNFSAVKDAVYYARVIEVPRPRWTTRDADFFGVERPDEAPEFIQDRAYSSPIWYQADVLRQ